MGPFRWPTVTNFITRKKKENFLTLESNKLPRHIAIIMDGNGRWAQKRGLPRAAGHRAGVESLREIVEACAELGIAVLTVYAFSTENWKRPQEEVDVLMNLLTEYLQKESTELHRKNVRINPIGRIASLPETARHELARAVNLTKDNKGLILNIALNYGGRAELVDATRAIAQKVISGEISPQEITEEVIAANLYTGSLPDPDLLIRPSGEFRISNYLLWQSAYTEFWFTDVFWPEFKREHLYQALQDYICRERRFGGIKK
ncbi:isoprenyl transferase [Zhaonella formicivorans]|uniref:isoprenyl transferase n=1 Tax=Zhaonella formicivorans TaxID=2528593 RepID=UPI0010DCB176|nr:isoprenyl transferase [Zhaonella formicivorans]